MTGADEKRSHLKEYTTAISATLIMVAAGNSIGWTSPTLPLLQGAASPIPITADEGSWMSSLMILCSVISAVPAALLADRIGRKATMLLAAVPYVGGWLIVAFATRAWHLYVARVLPGLGYGIIYTVGPLFLGEIASDEVRGSLSILMTFMNKLGILMQYCIGPYVSMRTLAGINLCVPAIFALTFAWVAESPYYHVKEGDFGAAEASLVRLRGSDCATGEELKKIEASVAEDTKNRGSVADLVSDPTNRRALLTTLALFATQQFCGSAAVISYAQPIFLQAGGRIEASHASIIVGCVQLCVAAASAVLVDRVGRRPLLLLSSCGCAVTSCAIGAYFYFKDCARADMSALGFTPVLMIVLYVVSYTIGLSTVPLAVTAEVFPTTVKSSATSALQIFVGVSTFTVTKLFQVIADGLGNHVVFWCFSGFSLAGLAYIYAMLPETKGRSFAVIQRELRGGRRKAPAGWTPSVDVSQC